MEARYGGDYFRIKPHWSLGQRVETGLRSFNFEYRAVTIAMATKFLEEFYDANDVS